MAAVRKDRPVELRILQRNQPWYRLVLYPHAPGEADKEADKIRPSMVKMNENDHWRKIFRFGYQDTSAFKDSLWNMHGVTHEQLPAIVVQHYGGDHVKFRMPYTGECFFAFFSVDTRQLFAKVCDRPRFTTTTA